MFGGVIIFCFAFYNLAEAASTADHLVISQVQITGGSGKTTNDFVEIYNPTGSAIDLKGYRLVKRTQTGATDTSLKSWTDSATVKAHGYYFWANSNFTDIAVPADVTTTGSLADDNGIALRNGPNDTGIIIDSVGWGAAANAFVEGAVFASNPEAGQSLERKPGSGAGNGEDGNNNAQDFFLQTTAHPRNSASAPEPSLDLSPALPSPGEGEITPPAGQTTQPTPSFSLEITEIMPNPKGKDAGNEWVEVRNSGTAAADLSGWFLDDDSVEAMPGASAWPLPDGSGVGAGAFLVLQIPKGRFSLNNSGADAVRLFDAGKNLKLRQDYSGVAKEGFSYAKDSTGQWAWRENPTPGSSFIFLAPTAYSSDLAISEVLPNPEGADQDSEFIELYNRGNERVNLADWVLTNGRKRYVISEDDLPTAEIAPRGYLVFYREVTNISLKNSGEDSVQLYNPAGDLVDALTFDAADREGLALARSENRNYLWTSSPTPGAANIFEGGLVKKEAKASAPKGSAKKQPAPAPKEEPTPEVKLSEIRSMPPGEEISTSGTVSVEPGILDDNVLYLAGSGIRVSFGGAVPAGIHLGDTIKLTGTVSEFHREAQLEIAASSTPEILPSTGAVEPHPIATGEVGENTEGYLVELSGVITKSSGETFFIDDGSGEARVYIKASTGIEKPRTKKGDEIRVLGIVSQYDDNYRVLPRYQSDLVFGAVAGAATSGELPRTGIDVSLIIAVFATSVIIMKIKNPSSGGRKDYNNE